MLQLTRASLLASDHLQVRCVSSSCLKLSLSRAAMAAPLSRHYSCGGGKLPVTALSDEEKMMKETGT